MSGFIAHAPLRQSNPRLRDRSPTYAVAIEAYMTAIDLGADDRMAAALWAIVQREAAAADVVEGRG